MDLSELNSSLAPQWGTLSHGQRALNLVVPRFYDRRKLLHAYRHRQIPPQGITAIRQVFCVKSTYSRAAFRTEKLVKNH